MVQWLQIYIKTNIMKAPHVLFSMGMIFTLSSIPAAFASSGDVISTQVPESICSNYAVEKNYDQQGDALFSALTTPNINKKFFSTCWSEYLRHHERASLPGFYSFLANSPTYLTKVSELPHFSTGEKALFFQRLLLSQRNTVDVDVAIPLYVEALLAIDSGDDPEILKQLSALEALSPTFSFLSKDAKTAVEEIIKKATTLPENESFLLELRGLLALKDGTFSSFLKVLDLRKDYPTSIKTLFTIGLLNEGRSSQAKPKVLDALKNSYTMQQGLLFPTHESSIGFQQNTFTRLSKTEQIEGITNLFIHLGSVVPKNDTTTFMQEDISRASGVKMILDILIGKDIIAAYFDEHKDSIASYHMENYGEVLAEDAWYTPYALYALDHEYLKSGQALHLGDPISHAEILTILSRVTKLLTPYTDAGMTSNSISESIASTWFEEYLAKLDMLPKNVNLIEEIADTAFEKATKGELLRYVYLFLPEMKNK